ncbi:MAG: DEDD exonuclease domain-containing protein [Actinobacteria bacterium]|nr:DEDD exonuclease domain-containing protein [Actinomycetota bacterium]
MVQRSFDDLGTPLHQVTFCVVDVETTGGSAADGGLTEIGAVKLRGGECLGTFATLVNPGSRIPPSITVLTGITEAMVLPAPGAGEVLPTFLEVLGDAVIVGHNVRYDLGFLDAALLRSGRPRLANRWVDTCALARRLVRDEVPDCRLATLASRLRLAHRPAHRALADALATGDLLHVLLERAAGLGVMGLDDLLALATMAGHPQAAKLRLTEDLPRAPGVYLFRDAAGRVLYVGKATNLRARVRSYFSGDERRKVGALLREAQRIDHRPCATTLEAAVREVRLIHAHQPRYNRHARTWRSSAYVRLTHERFPRLAVVREVRGDALHLGPLPSGTTARRVVDAIQTAAPIRRCTGAPGGRGARCAAAQLGVARCPCAGDLSEVEYAAVVEQVRRGLTVDPGALLAPLAVRIAGLAAAERFEEAADVRDRAAALAAALRRQRRFDWLRGAGRVVVEVPGQGGAELRRGRLVRAWSERNRPGLEWDDEAIAVLGPDGPDGPPRAGAGAGAGSGSGSGFGDGGAGGGADENGDGDGGGGPGARAEQLFAVAGDVPRPAPGKDEADELLAVAAWLDRCPPGTRVVHVDGCLAEPWPRLASFTPRPTPPLRAGAR